MAHDGTGKRLTSRVERQAPHDSDQVVYCAVDGVCRKSVSDRSANGSPTRNSGEAYASRILAAMRDDASARGTPGSERAGMCAP